MGKHGSRDRHQLTGLTDLSLRLIQRLAQHLPQGLPEGGLTQRLTEGLAQRLIRKPHPLTVFALCLGLTVAGALGMSHLASGGGSDDTISVASSVRPARTSSPSPSTMPSLTPSTTPSLRSSITSSPGLTATDIKPSAPVFHWRQKKVKAADLGPSWHQGCPVRPSALRAVSVQYWGFDGQVHTGVLILHKSMVARARPVFATMFKRQFPLRSVRPASAFGGSDKASMAADNTSAFNCRRAVATGAPTWSRHAYGKAIDVNTVENPYLFAKLVLPPAGKKFTGRSKAKPGLIRRGDPIYKAFKKAGFRWGGSFSNPDYQHFDR
jgi:D-alanyl-D-alanine carboxypeptidase